MIADSWFSLHQRIPTIVCTEVFDKEYSKDIGSGLFYRRAKKSFLKESPQIICIYKVHKR